MRKILLHGYARADGGVTVSPDAMGGAEDSKERVRLVADEGLAITNGKIVVTVIDMDADDVSNWSDCALPMDQQEPMQGGGDRGN